MSSVEDRVRAAAAERLGDSINLEEKIGSDSLEKLDLLVAVENEFNIHLSDKEIQSLSTFADAVKLLEEKVNGNTL